MLHLAAILFFLLGLAHSVLGERYILVRLLRRDDLPRLFGGQEFTRQTLRFAWHITTVAWWGLGVLLVFLARGELTPRVAAQVIGFTAIASGLLPLYMTRGRHRSWMILFVIGALAMWWASV